MTENLFDPARLPMWVVYDHPADLPDYYIARLWYSLPAKIATETIMGDKSLANLRTRLLMQGATRIDREVDDAPIILEIWIL